MTRALTIACLLSSTIAAADPAACNDAKSPACMTALIDEASAHAVGGRFAEALALFRKVHAVDPRPELLFAMGQMEFNLRNYKSALDFYERYLKTNPKADDAALAVQAIAVTRHEIENPPPKPLPPKVIEVSRPADKLAWSVAIGAGVASLSAASLLVVARQRVGDVSGGYADYDRRVEQARSLRFGAVAAGAVGAGLAIGATIRWLRRSDDNRIAITTNDGAIGLAVGGTL